ncbi:unnamed protein product [Cylicocyclus nassatus]|uniref:WD repeat-containing protein 7 n=1 Tax=Cylicocyclus nassatus TaxID=53992 RepID=A0AA36M4A7_CYLNA|nr:unnamed protein product [Cylicocyclus nassatus]
MATGDPSPPSSTPGLVVPLVIWGPKPPENKMTVVRYMSDNATIITGAQNGHIITWNCNGSTLTPGQLMIGHEAPITAISPTNSLPTSTRFISASCDGHLCLWDIQDGRCIDSVSTLFIHRHMQPYTYKSSRHTRSTRLFCIGDYSDIVVMDPQDLTVVFLLSSRVEPDWVCSYEIVQRPSKPEQCIGVSMAGMIKIWSLVELEKKDLATPLYEDESKRLELRDVKAVSFNPVNHKVFLVVCSNVWQLLDLDELAAAITYECPARAVSGKILCIDKVAIAYNDHTVRVYQLPLDKLEGAQARQAFGVEPKNFLGMANPFEFAVLDTAHANPRSWLNDVTFTFARQTGDSNLFQVARVSHAGQLLIWRIPNFDKDFLNGYHSISQFPLKFDPSHEESLAAIWSSLSDNEQSSLPVLDPGDVTSSLFVSSQGKLLIGRADGLIVMTYACETLSRQLLDVSLEKPTTRRLNGHKAAVTNLFYPFEHHPRFDPQVLISGADDFAVIVWNINTAAKLYKFSVHGGPILRFLVPPANTSKQMSKCICSVAADNSVALLNIRDMKLALLASRHPHPVTLVKWRPLDDFMLVRLDDGSVYVWQMETANMDRVVTGVVAEEVLAACDEQIGREEGTEEVAAPQAIVLMRTLRYRGMDMMKGRTSTGASDSSTPKVETPPSTYDTGAIQLGPPMTIHSLPGCNHGAHLIQFEVGSLIGGIVNLDASDEALMRRPSAQSITKADCTEEAPNAELSRRLMWQFESNLYLDIARLLLSFLHAWNLDKDLDAVCIKKLALNKPKQQLYFGNVSRHGQLSVVLPQRTQRSFDTFSTDLRWQASHSLTTTHLLAVISTANTLMGMRNAASQIENTRRSSLASAHPLARKTTKEGIISERQQLKQGWSLLAALHCVLLPDHVHPRSSYAAPRIELLARRWQDSCVEIREAAQALLIRELSRLGASGRRRLIESWTPFLPPLLDPALSIFGARLQSSVPALPPSAPPIPPRHKSSPPPLAPVPEPSIAEDGESGVQQVRRNQATAIILLGVVGAEFGDELNRADLTRATALSLLELLVAAPSPLLPVHSPLRRAAIDLLGRGFVHWEPHLEISKVVLGLLDLAANTEKQPPPPIIGAPLSPIADACRTARHALTLIATARPTALLSALSMEVARYNSAAQHQTIQHTVVSPLLKSRTEVLRIIEELSEKRYGEVVEMMLPVGDILVHCLDTSLLKQKTLSDVFPPITKFYMVAYCAPTRRIAFGGKNGTCVVHELRAAKAHSLQAHQGPVTAVAFSEDGKYLATYGGQDAKINFWQTSQTFLGMGQSQMKLAKTQPAPSLPPVPSSPSNGVPAFRPRLVWINSKALTLMLPEGREQRFSI